MDISLYPTIYQYLYQTALQFPQKIGLQIQKNNQTIEYTYEKLINKIKNISDVLSLHCKQGERILLLTDNCPEGMIFYFSILAASATPVLIDPNLPSTELEKLINKADVRLIIGPEKHLLTLYSTSISQIKTLVFPSQLYQGFFINKNVDESDYDTNIAAILFTSGTTGSPKGVTLTHRNILAAIKGSIPAIQITANDRMLSILPIFHISSLLQNILCLVVGATVSCLTKLDKQELSFGLTHFQPTMIGVVPLVLDNFLQTIESALNEKNRITRTIFLLSVILGKKINRIQAALFSKITPFMGGHLSKIICGGAATNPKTVKKLTELGFIVIEAYGLTETCGPISATPFKQTVFGTAGLPFSTTEIKINNPNAAGEGEICIRGESLMRGYFRDPEASAQVIKENWFYTKDIGRFQKQGYLNIIGRTEEVIILSSGKKVQPSEIEKYYANISDVEEFAVFKMPDGYPASGTLNAAIVIKKGSSPLAQKRIEEAFYKRGAKLPAYFQINRVHFLNELPKTALKIKRNQLADIVKKQINPAPTEVKKNITSIKITEIESWLLTWIGNKNKTVLNKKDVHHSFIYFGLDSLSITQLCMELGNWLKLKVDQTLIWHYSTIHELAKYLAGDKDQSVEQTSHVNQQEPIAIVGIACRLPGANNLEELWNLLIENKTAISDIPRDRWNSEEYYAKEILPGKMNTRWGGFIHNVYDFDASFFEISPAEAENIDPQHRLLLELTWEAFECSGICPSSLFKSDAGVYIGTSANDYGTLSARKMDINALGPYNAIGNNVSAAAGRISYFFGLQGICKSIDTACSSSLVAIHDACSDLQLGKSKLAIAGGINTILSPFTTIMLSQAHMLSSDGQCKVFDENANGYVRSEGGAVILLKRLSDAIKDKDPLFGIIRSVGLNQDGRSNGLTAPNGEAQIKLFKSTLNNAGLTSHDINYIEAHGTGTPLGDPIETMSIAAIYQDRAADKPILLSSVKSNLGHLEAGAGMAGLAKTLLVLKHQIVPGQVNLKKVNPLISNIPGIKISQTNYEASVQFAAVNSFGFTGINSQIILERAPSVIETTSDKKPFYLLPISAKNLEALQKRLWDLLEWADKQVDLDLAALSYTLSCRRTHFLKRSAFIVKSIDCIKESLASFRAGNNPIHYYHKDHFGESLSTDPYKTQLIEAAKNYVQGEDIEWNEWFPLPLRTISNLPPYPFSRKKYCLSFLDNLKNTTHPLLKNKNLLSEDCSIYESQITAPFPTFLSDHKIFDFPVMPGAMSVSVFISLLSRIRKDKWISMESFSFLYPMIFQLEEKKSIFVKLSSLQDGQYDFEITSALHNETDPKLHVKAKSKDENIELETITLDEYKKNCIETYPVNALYEKVKNLNIVYGECYQYLESIWVGENQVLGKLKTNEDNRYLLSPGQIDGFFQLLFAIFKDSSETDLFVPFKIEKIYLNTAEKPTWVYAKLNTQSNESLKSANFQLFNEKGQLIGFITDFTAKKFSKSAFLKNIAITDDTFSYFQESWEFHPLLSSENNSPNRWLVVSEQPIPLSFSEIETSTISPSDKEGIQQQLSQTTGLIYYINAMQTPSETADLKNYFQHEVRSLVGVIQLFLTCNQLAKPFWIVTRLGDFISPIRSLIKTLLMEYPHFKLHYLELSDDITASQFANEITSNDPETFIRYAKTKRQVLRLNHFHLADKNGNTLLFPSDDLFHLRLPKDGLIQHFSLEALALPVLKEFDIAVQVKAVGLNFRDLLSVLKLYPGEVGPLGSDFSGVVTAVGEKVTTTKVGDSVFGFTTTNALASHAISHQNLLINKPSHLTFEQAATLPTTFLTAHLALNLLAKIKKDDKVLIHAATGGVGLAAIKLAKKAQAIIFATAGNDEKRDYLKSLGITHIYDSRSTLFAEEIKKDTQEKGVDIVLNCLSGPNFIESSLSACGKNACFLEIGKRNIWSKEQMQSHRPDINYHIIALDEVVKSDSQSILLMLQTLGSYFTQKDLTPLPVTFFNIKNAIDAFRYMQQAKHIGKIVISPEKQVQTISANDSYLITGGLGGLGLLFCEWLIRQGAKHIVLVSRNSVTTPLVEKLKQDPNLTIEVVNLDIANKTEVKHLFSRFGKEWPALKGVIHAAGINKDAAFITQQWQDFEEIFASKLYGAWLTHQYSLEHKLDFFILFSSVASAFGSSGQANYAVGNAFLDDLARFRQSNGLPATCINWGPWKDIGMAKHLSERMEKFGFKPISNEVGISLFEAGIQQNVPNLIIAPLYLNKMKTLLPINNSFFNNIKIHATSDKGKKLLLADIKNFPAKELPHQLRKALQECMADILGMQANQVDMETPFPEFGMDSLMMLKLQDLIETHLGKNTMPSLENLHNYSTVEKLADYLEKQLLSSQKPLTETSENDEIEPQKVEIEKLNREKVQIQSQLATLPQEMYTKIENDIKKIIKPPFSITFIKKTLTPILLSLSRLYLRVETKGIENLPQNQPFMLCPNHSSYLDGIIIFRALGKKSNDLVGLFAKDYFDKKALIFMLSCFGHVIPFDRSNQLTALPKNLKYIEHCKNANKSILLFPEGTRSYDGQLQTFKQGVSWFLEQTSLLVIPTYIEGAHRLMPRGSRFPKPGRVKVTFAQPLDMQSEFKKENYIHERDFYSDITNKIRDSIQFLAEESVT